MHDLIKDNKILKSYNFGTDTPPILDPKKGKWVPRTTIDPEYDSEKQKKTLVKTVNEDSTVWEYIVSDLTEEEFNQRQPSEDQVDQEAINKIARKQFETMVVSDEEINDYASLFPAFKVGEIITQEMMDAEPVRRQYKNEVWEAIQPHTTQLDWLPPDVPALWGKVYNPETIPLWVQPFGAGDPNIKHTGDKVQWPEGTIWISTVDDNIWEPGVYGWEEVL